MVGVPLETALPDCDECASPFRHQFRHKFRTVIKSNTLFGGVISERFVIEKSYDRDSGLLIRSAKVKVNVIRRMESGKYLVSLRKLDGKQKLLGVFDTRRQAEDQQHAGELLKIQRMIAREGILSSVERIVRCMAPAS